MYYFEKNENEVVKYEVFLHEKGINEVRDRLIKDYSCKIKIDNFLCFSGIDKIETDRIKDFVNYNDRVCFNYYIHPKLVIYIDMLMCGNVSILDDIFNYNQAKINYKSLINENYLFNISNYISNVLNIDFNYNDLLFYINKLNLKINNDDYMFLKEELLKCISFKKIDSIKLEEFYKITNFLELNTNEVLNSGLKKKQKRINRINI